jgi:hypothetical protein
VQTRDAVLVTGPWLAGSSSLIAVLRQRLPDVTFVETDELGVTEAPMAVVFVAAAVAPLTDSDCTLLDLATANTDLVIGVVSKIDAHPNWRDVLAADEKALGAHADRYRAVPWVGAATAAERAEPNVDELVELLRQRLGDPAMARRNRLRAWETRLQASIKRCEEEAADADARLAELRERRAAVEREHTLARSDRAHAVRTRLEQARTQLSEFARNRCASVRDELQQDAATIKRRKLSAFADYVRQRVGTVVTEVHGGVTDHLRDMAAELRLTAPAAPPPPPSPQVPAPPESSRNREPLVNWVFEVVAALRSAVDEHVAERVRAAETAWTAELAARDEAGAAELAAQRAAVDTELRERALAAARAGVLRTRDLPGLRAAVDRVRSELAARHSSNTEETG